ncbi:hypothetical protein [Neptunicella sp. SCSIO 80796]|uniref:hypothetical protein n=1 Tax=Neptunicella plasticusilytica TaxID=3117012 RepID=UPI003A4DA690
MISRLLSPTMLAAATASPSRLLAFLEMDWPSGWVRCHSGVGERIYNGNSYLGVGEFGGIGEVTENSSDGANRLNLSLKVMDPTLINVVLNEDPNGRDCFMHLVALDEHRRILEGHDYFFDGEMVDVKVKRGDAAKQIPAIINIPLGDWFERWATAPEAARTTDAAQQFLHPGDQFFDQCEIIAGSPLHSLPVKNNGNGGSFRGKDKWKDLT